jgi:hypothetical protein
MSRGHGAIVAWHEAPGQLGAFRLTDLITEVAGRFTYAGRNHLAASMAPQTLVLPATTAERQMGGS